MRDLESEWVDLRIRPLATFALVGVGIAGVFSWDLGWWMYLLDGLLVVAVGALWLYAYKGRITTELDTVSQSVRITYRILGVTFFRREFPRADITCVLRGWDDESPLVNEAAGESGIHPVTLVLAGDRKWVIQQSTEASAANELVRSLEERIGVQVCT